MVRIPLPGSRISSLAVLLVTCWLMPLSLAAQDLEPRRWTHLPVGTSTLGIGYAGKSTDIYFNPAIGITDGTADINAWLARYSYSFDWSGTTARVDGILPYVSGNWRGLVGGEPGQRTIRTGGDPLVRLSVNFFGSPALKGQEFRDFLDKNPVRTTAGASLALVLPLGGYDPEELINVGRNRYVLRPQLGVLHHRGPWSFELTGSVYLYSKNTSFLESDTLSQNPVYALQAHVTRTFRGNFWLGAGVAYAGGGKMRLNGARIRYEVDNVLWNLVGSYKITGNQSVTLAWQQGRTQVDSGSDTDSWVMSWGITWN